MITLKIDGKMIRVDCYDELLQLPGFLRELQMEEADFAAAVGRCYWPMQVQCGLNGCHVWHNRGWVVSNKQGLMTNVGQDCARSHFGLLFQESAKSFDDDLRRQELRDAVRDFQSAIDAHREKLRDVKTAPHDAAWAFYEIHRLIGEALPRSIAHSLMEMAKSQDPRIVVVREGTQQEIAQEEARRGKNLKSPLVIEDVVGRIHGIESLKPENDLRDLVTYNLGQGLKAVEVIDVDTASDSDMRRAKKWIDGFDDNVRRARAVFIDARKFLTKRNLRQLERGDFSTFEIDGLRRAIAHLPEDVSSLRLERAA